MGVVLVYSLEGARCIAFSVSASVLSRKEHDEIANRVHEGPSVSIPAPIRWEVHRIVTSEQYKASLIEVQRDWSIDDVLDAHEVLDAFEKLARLEQRRWQR